MSAGKRKFTQHIIPNPQPFKSREHNSLEENGLPDQWCSSTVMPIDYEEYITKNKTLIVNDLYRETILFPQDDLKIIRIPHRHQMLNNGVPEVALKNSVFVSNPLARHAIAFFATTEWIYVQQVSSAYRGSFHVLPFLSDINELGGTLSQYWFSIDQSIAANKDSPNHIADSVHLPNSAGSKSRASKELQVRSRRSTTTGGGFVKSNQTIGEVSATGLVNRFTGSYQSKDQVKYEKVSCDSVLSRRGSKTKDQTQSDDEALVDNNNRNSENISSMSCDGRLSESGKSSQSIYLECQLVICNREKYQNYLRVLEGLLSSGSGDKYTATANTTNNNITNNNNNNNNTKSIFEKHEMKCYCLRQIQIEELSESDRQRHLSRTTSRTQNISVGLHVIAPYDWRASNIYSSHEDHNVIYLDTIDSVRSIGDYWIRLERLLPSASSSSSPSSAQLSSNKAKDEISTSNGLLNDEIFIYFDPTMNDAVEKRQTWLNTIELALKLESYKRHMGYHHHQQHPHFSADNIDASGSKFDLFKRSNNADSVRSALQRYAQETELFVIRQRQKGRIKLVTLFPDVRIRQYKGKNLTREHVGNSLTQVNSKDALSPFPDRTAELCSRRFLATCLNLHSKIRANIDVSGSTSAYIENPEPYFVTMFLVDVNDGCRVSEDFYWNPNSPIIDSMLPSDQFRSLPWLSSSSSNNTVSDIKNQSTDINDANSLNHNSSSPHHNTTPGRIRGHAPPPPQNNLISPYGTQNSISLDCLHKCRSALFSIPSSYHANSLYLVVRVDKVLSGPITTAVEKYLKNTSGTNMNDYKTGSSIQKTMVNYCRNIGRYRMPFAWGARSLNSSNRFLHLFKMDSNKISEQGLIQAVQMLSRLSSDYNNSPPVYDDSNANLTNNDTTATTNATAHNNIISNTVDSNHHYNIPESLIQSVKSSKTIGRNIITNTNTDNTLYPTEQDRLFIDIVERSLKTQMLPMRFELIISELIDQHIDPNAKMISRIISSNLETYIPTVDVTNYSLNCYIPSSHPVLMSDEVIREVENLFDFNSPSTSSSATTTTTVTGVSSHNDDSGLTYSDDTNSLSRTGSLQRSFLNNSLTGKSNRDSLMSNISMGSLPGTLVSASNDLPKIINTSAIQTRTNSLDRMEYGVQSAQHSTTSKLLPFTSFFNTLYVCPKSLNLSVKHSFPRARNLSCFIELRSNDSLDSSAALKVFYTRPSVRQPTFDSWFNTSVIYHDTNPNFGDQAKICLPLNLTPDHHLLFRFYHVSCETAATNLTGQKEKTSSYKKPVESSTGYSWIPILGTYGNFNVGTFQLRVASTIQPGYLKHSTIQQNTRSSNSQNVSGNALSFNINGSSNTNANNNNNNNSVDLTWIDNGKFLFKVDLKPLSSIYTHDPVLSKFFRVCGDLLPKVLYMSPSKVLNINKQKQNRVTFGYDVVIPSNSNSNQQLSSTASPPHSSPLSTKTKQTVNSSSILQNTTSINLHLCNAMKALLLITPTALVQFLPVILNQFMEIIILSAETSARWFNAGQREQQQQQQEEGEQQQSSMPSSNSTHENTEYSWFKSLKNNRNNNIIIANDHHHHNNYGVNDIHNNNNNNNISNNSSNSTPDDVLKTAVSTLAILISELNAQIPNDTSYYPLKSTNDLSCSDGLVESNTSACSDRLKHNLLKTYVEFAFNPDQLLTTCINHYLNDKEQSITDTKNVVIDSRTNVATPLMTASSSPSRKSIVNQYFPLSSLHHSIIRGLILVLWDTHCPGHILTHLFDNIWFSLALIVKSMTQYLCISKKIWAERSGDSRFSSLFCEDLTIFIQLIGSRLLSSFGNTTPLRNPLNKNNDCSAMPLSATTGGGSTHTTTPLCIISSSGQLLKTESSVSLSTSQTSKCTSVSESVAPKNSLGESVNRQSLLTKHTSNDVFNFNRIDVINAMGKFLGHLFNLMDRGYVLKRVRDLLTFLEISPRMPVDKIDQLNELRFELLRSICEHEHFIPLNLPMLNISDGSNLGVEISLTDQFCQQHFLIGVLLSQLSCLLSGCINTGSWALLRSTSQCYRQPVIILRNLLIKHCLDPRYHSSKAIQARICSLYLPLVRLMLDYYDSLGPPGGALQTAVIAAAARRDYEESLLITDGNSNSGTFSRRHQRSFDKSNKTGKSNVFPNSSTTNTMSNSTISHRPQSMISDYSLEALNNCEGNLQITNSDSGSFTSSLSTNSGSTVSFIQSISNSGFSHGKSSPSNTSDGQSTASANSAAYLTKDGKVQQHILDQIAGVNRGGSLQQRIHKSNRLQGQSNSSILPPSATSSTGIGMEEMPPHNDNNNNNKYPRSHSIQSVDGSQNSFLLSSHASSSTLTLTGVGMENNNNNNNNIMLNGGMNTLDDEYLHNDIMQYKNGENYKNHHHQELSPTSSALDMNLQNSDQDWAKQVLTLAGVYPDRVNDAKSTSSDSQDSVSTPVAGMPLGINISDIEHSGEHDENLISDTPASHHHHHHARDSHRLLSHPYNHRFNFQRIFIPDLLLTKEPIIRPHIHRRPCDQNISGPRRLTDNCQRDLYICLLHILSTITVTHLKALLQSFTVQERLRFLNILKFAIQHLRYRGKHCIQQYEHISRSGVGRTGGIGGGNLLNISNTLAGNTVAAAAAARRRTTPVGKSLQNDSSKQNSHDFSGQTAEDIPKMKVLLKANLATESSMIILDILSTFATVFKSELNSCKPNDPVFRCLLETYVAILSNNPSDHVIRHTFSALRVFINQNSQTLFSESTDILSTLCLAGLRCSNQCFLAFSSSHHQLCLRRHCQQLQIS
ncbi:unnamed protein product [Trichobilharzia szidati]|nr:unnamed protein product [Trichobilharzia szidati]